MEKSPIFLFISQEKRETSCDIPTPFHLPTSVHKDVTERLKHINPSLYREVGLVLEQNKQERHWRGGEATRKKYMEKRESKKKDKGSNTAD